MSSAGGWSPVLSVVGGLKVHRRDVPAVFVEAVVVEPVTPAAALLREIERLPWLSVVLAYFVGLGSGLSMCRHSPVVNLAIAPPGPCSSG